MSIRGVQIYSHRAPADFTSHFSMSPGHDKSVLNVVAHRATREPKGGCPGFVILIGRRTFCKE